MERTFCDRWQRETGRPLISMLEGCRRGESFHLVRNAMAAMVDEVRVSEDVLKHTKQCHRKDFLRPRTAANRTPVVEYTPRKKKRKKEKLKKMKQKAKRISLPLFQTGHCCATRNNLGEDVTLHGNTEGERNNIEEEEIGGVSGCGLSGRRFLPRCRRWR